MQVPGRHGPRGSMQRSMDEEAMLLIIGFYLHLDCPLLANQRVVPMSIPNAMYIVNTTHYAVRAEPGFTQACPA
jgi:hypothetical protein